LDDGDIRERQRPEEVYPLGITILYANSPVEPRAYAAASSAAEALKRISARAFRRQSGARAHIDLWYCNPISALTEQRLEYTSLATDPLRPSPWSLIETSVSLRAEQQIIEK
jgi:hypothetical protein